MPYLPALEVETSESPDASVIWLHGLGASGYDFEPIVSELSLPRQASIRFIFPHAPSLPVTVNGGYVMPAWYDILEIDFERKVDVQQLEHSASEIARLIDREIERGITSERIVLAGFSQGGAVAYHAALTYTQPLAGLLAMSTYFASADHIQPASASEGLPIQIFHGLDDDVVPESLGEKAQALLADFGFEAGYSTYSMEHSVCQEELDDISECLRRWLY